MRKILVLCCLINGFFVAAQNVINLSGRWDFKTEENSEYNETVVLPGSMLTNNKGNDVSINTGTAIPQYRNNNRKGHIKSCGDAPFRSFLLHQSIM